MNARKLSVVSEVITSDALGVTCDPICRVAALGIIKNPFAGVQQGDLSDFFAMRGTLGAQLVEMVLRHLQGAPISCGKAAIVGMHGDMEHGGAVIHPKLGAPMRAAIGGGEAMIASNVKLGAPETIIDIPLGHKDNPWSFDHFDTMTVFMADAPLPDEIVMYVAYANGGRPIPRCGKGPVKT